MCPWCAVVQAPAEYRSSNPFDNFASRSPTSVNTANTDRIGIVTSEGLSMLTNVQGLGSSQRTDNVQGKGAAEATAPVTGSLGTLGNAPTGINSSTNFAVGESHSCDDTSTSSTVFGGFGTASIQATSTSIGSASATPTNATSTLTASQLHKLEIGVSENQEGLKRIATTLQEERTRCEEHLTDLTEVQQELSNLRGSIVESTARAETVDERLSSLEAKVQAVTTSTEGICSEIVADRAIRQASERDALEIYNKMQAIHEEVGEFRNSVLNRLENIAKEVQLKHDQQQSANEQQTLELRALKDDIQFKHEFIKKLTAEKESGRFQLQASAAKFGKFYITIIGCSNVITGY